MSYNSNCKYQNCAGGCCNFYGDCPEWYSNGVTQYTNCYYYYGANPPNVLGAIAGSLIGICIIIALLCICYRYERKKLEEQSERVNGNVAENNKIANQTESSFGNYNGSAITSHQKSNGLERTQGHKQVIPLGGQNEQIFGIGKNYTP